jgi:hypothetical protein
MMMPQGQMAQGQPMQAMGPGGGQAVVVVQQQQPAAQEEKVTCCGCFEIPCGMTTLMVIEILYIIGLIIAVAGMMVVGAVASGVGGAAKEGNISFSSSSMSS